jgi:hypothetical protein
MLISDIINRNPFRLLSEKPGHQLTPGQLGAVLARAGVGKTAFLVQIALNGLLQDKKVLHISINDPVNKVSLWYDEVFRHITDQYQDQSASADEIWQNILPHRFIMTFKVEGFSVPKLKERLSDLSEQKIFSPDIVIIDGLPLEGDDIATLQELKELSSDLGFLCVATVLTHRHDETDASGLPVKFSHAIDLFDAVIQLQPEKDKIHVCAIKGTSGDTPDVSLLLDPESHLITLE